MSLPSMKERIIPTKERLRLTVIEELVEGKINASSAVSKLNLSVRQVKRLKKRFKQCGYDCLIHGLRGKTGLRKIDQDIEDKVVLIIKEKYYDFGPLMAWEKIKYIHQINIGGETIRQIMIRHNIWQSKKRKGGQYFCWCDRRAS